MGVCWHRMADGGMLALIVVGSIILFCVSAGCCWVCYIENKHPSDNYRRSRYQLTRAEDESHNIIKVDMLSASI